jgi:D-cysteine desulfhydrase family pyridoxal phosphate-dependent enzyme
MANRIESLPRVALAALPTPLQPLKRLSAALGGPEIWVKRDDLTGAGGGGNKVRKLEFLLADALAQKAEVVVTGGAIQSNHVRQTAALCGALGLGCEGVLNEPLPGRGPDYAVSGNVFLTRLAGATVHVIPNSADTAEYIKRVAQGSRAAGKRPYVMPVGGSTPLGAVGYANAVLELCEQMDDFDTIVLATGSGGTQAGLLGGLALAGAEARVLGFSVGAPLERQRGKVLELLPGLAELLGVEIAADAVLVDDQSIGPGYGVPTPEVKEALAMAASLEGLYLDPVYTGKAMAGLIRHARAGRFRAGEKVVFLHTGGLPGLFGYASELSEGAKKR